MVSTNKIALITGASRGIGKAIAEKLHNAGYTVVGTATTENGALGITDWLQSQGNSGKGFVLNVASKESVEQALKSIKETIGEPQILINNAGITRDNLFLRMKEEDWTSVLETNLTGAFRLCSACLRTMVKARWGRIINVGSVVGSMGNAGQVNYAAAKAGLLGLTKSLAREVASRGITVNLVAPGFIETDMTNALTKEQHEQLIQAIPVGRIGKASEIASAILFLISEEANYITGETLHINGGMYMA